MPVEHSVHQTRHLHKWPSVMATHTILREHEPEDWEKDMRRGLPLEKCIYNISIPYCCRHFFFPLRRPDTVQPANCKLTWTYDLPFSDHMLLAHFVSIGRRYFYFSIYKLICWPSQKECNLWNCYFLLSSKSRDTSSAIKDICVSIFKSYKNDMTLKRWL